MRACLRLAVQPAGRSATAWFGWCLPVGALNKQTPRLTDLFCMHAVGLFAPGEQCSAAGALGMLYFFILAVRAFLACLLRLPLLLVCVCWLVGWLLVYLYGAQLSCRSYH